MEVFTLTPTLSLKGEGIAELRKFYDIDVFDTAGTRKYNERRRGFPPFLYDVATSAPFPFANP